MKHEDQLKDLLAVAMSEFLKTNYGRSIELLSRVIENNPNHKMAFLTRGTAHLKVNKIEEAIADFDRAISLDPSYHRAFHMRGVARVRQGNHEGALADFNKATQINPEYGAAYYSRATLYAKMGQDDLATEDIETVTHLTNYTIETFANENNLWRSQHLALETIMETELER